MVEATNIGDLSVALTEGLYNGVLKVAESLPAFIIAAVVFIVGLVISWFVESLVKRLFDLVRFEELLEVHKLEDSLGKVKLSNIFATLAKYYVIFLTFHLVILSLVGPDVSSVIGPVVYYIPLIIGATLVIVGAALLGEFIKEKLVEHGKEQYLVVLGSLSKAFLLLVGAFTALDILGIKAFLARDILVTLTQGLSLGVGLAIGIAFGLGGQELAKDIIKNARKRIGY